MERYIFTFGSGHLKDFLVKPESVMLVVEGKDWLDCRKQVFSFDGIGEMFCTNYSYDEYVDEFTSVYKMVPYTFEDLENCRRSLK